MREGSRGGKEVTPDCLLPREMVRQVRRDRLSEGEPPGFLRIT
jgi:hypothetical protein